MYSESCRVEMPETQKLCWINTEQKDSSGEKIEVMMAQVILAVTILCSFWVLGLADSTSWGPAVQVSQGTDRDIFKCDIDIFLMYFGWRPSIFFTVQEALFYWVNLNHQQRTYQLYGWSKANKTFDLLIIRWRFKFGPFLSNFALKFFFSSGFPPKKNPLTSSSNN